jgi:hypothetical protein
MNRVEKEAVGETGGCWKDMRDFFSSDFPVPGVTKAQKKGKNAY